MTFNTDVFRCLAGAAIGLAVTSPANAHPDMRARSLPAAHAARADGERPTRWYGYQGAIADAAAAALLVGAISTFKLCLDFQGDGRSCDNTASATMFLGSVGTYALGAPVI